MTQLPNAEVRAYHSFTKELYDVDNRVHIGNNELVKANFVNVTE